MKSIGRVTALALLASSNAFALPTTFDFESVPTGAIVGPITLFDGSVSLTVTSESSQTDLQVAISGTTGPMSIGRGITGRVPGSHWEPLRFTFSEAISDITFGLGDGGGDDDSPWLIRAYDGAGVQLATATGAYPALSSAGVWSSLSGLGGASYFILSSGVVGPGANSITWDVQSYSLASSTTAAEPAVFSLLGLGLLGIAWSRARVRRFAV